VASVVALVLATVLFGWSARTIWSNPGLLRLDAESATAPPSSVAILDLVDDSPNGDLGWLASGLAEELTHELATIRALDVSARTAVKAAQTRGLSVDEIGEELSVGTLVEGSVTASDEIVHVTIQLIDVASGTHLLTQEVEEDLDDPVALRDRLRDVIVEELRSRLHLEIDKWEDRQQTRSAEAWTLYAKGIEHEVLGDSLLGTETDVTLMEWAEAMRYFAAAREEDPDWYCPIVREGWLALRTSEIENRDNPGRPLRGDSASLFRLAHESVEVSDGAAAALEFRGALSHQWTEAYPTDSDLRDRAEEDLRAALDINPDLPMSLIHLGMMKQIDGDFDTAVTLLRAARLRDPFLRLSSQQYYQLSQVFVETREWDEARDLCDQGREKFPDAPRFPMCSLFVGSLAAEPLSPGRAWATADSLEDLLGDRWPGPYEIWAEATVARLLARLGMPDSALAVLEGLSPQFAEYPLATYTPASAYLQAGDTATALDLLEVYLNARPSRRVYLPNDWLFEAIHNHPRFLEITRPPEGAEGEAPGR
jgi:TolB-like protein